MDRKFKDHMQQMLLSQVATTWWGLTSHILMGGGNAAFQFYLGLVYISLWLMCRYLCVTLLQKCKNKFVASYATIFFFF